MRRSHGLQLLLCTLTAAAVLLQVLLIFNINVRGGLANGTRGVVERIVSIRDYLKQVSVASHWPGLWAATLLQQPTKYSGLLRCAAAADMYDVVSANMGHQQYFSCQLLCLLLCIKLPSMCGRHANSPAHPTSAPYLPAAVPGFLVTWTRVCCCCRRV